MQTVMSSTVFKKLFEVQILHDYFLTTSDGESFFDKNQLEKKTLITKKLANAIYDVNDFFEIVPIGKTALKMKEYKLIMSKTTLGFVIGVQVIPKNQAGEVVYKPSLKFKNDLNLTFSMKPKISFISSITNTRLQPQLPATYYFSNKEKEEFNEAVIPPYTSLPITNKAKNHQNGTFHEMGAIIDFGGTIKEALQKTDGTNLAHWTDIVEKRFVTEADRMLLPSNFVYPLKKEKGITQLDIVLEDKSNVLVKEIHKNNALGLENVLLNFTKIDENDKDSPFIPSGFYNLKIKENGGVEMTHPIYLNNEIYKSGHWGVIDIRADELNSPYSLLDVSGFLKTKIDVLFEKIPHPVFEVRFKNRKTYWRYRQDTDFTAAEIAATTAHLDHTPERLTSLKPKALTKALVPFINGVSLMLPHPRVPSIKVEQEKIYSEIFINQSNRLLNN